jgi:hypothetical protein
MYASFKKLPSERSSHKIGGRFYKMMVENSSRNCSIKSTPGINFAKLRFAWPGQKRRFSQYNSEKCRLKTIFFKLYRIGPLPLGVIAPNLRKNLSTLIAKIVFSRYFNDFSEKLKSLRFTPNFVGLAPAPRGRSSPICEKIQSI